ncbi:MAG: aldehyde dehydrogenase [Dorea sp.]|nr:aldehyde dehydrogenase [Dorea sp.]
MNAAEIRHLVMVQRKYFFDGHTLPVENRIQALKALKEGIEKHEAELQAALLEDLGKSSTEAYMCETGMVLEELSYMLRHVKSFARDQRVKTPIHQYVAKSYKKPSPYGVTLIMSPWNYPVLLTMGPLVDALAAGNTAIVKPSAYSPATSQVMKEILEECFAPEYVAVVTGGRAENTALLHEHFDYIFFTGSQTVGKEVMKAASEHLTPVTLELGGKSPCIVAEDANIRLAAKRIVFGKYLNCGQTCVAPDYIYVDRKVKHKLMAEIQKQIVRQYGKQPLTRKNYGKISNEKHFQRLCGLIDHDKVVWGGASLEETLQIEPTVIDNVSFSDPIMQEEIFGPLMPILTFDHMQEVISNLNSMPHPLALYIYSNNKETIENVTSHVGFGGGCVNDCIIHLATTEMGFGGFGESGMGAYHGKTGFDTFSHYKSIVDKKTWIDLPLRYQPYRKIYEKVIRIFMK